MFNKIRDNFLHVVEGVGNESCIVNEHDLPNKD